MLHQNALQAARITKLEEQLAAMTKRERRERKRNLHGGTMVYGEAAAQVAAEASVVAEWSKKAHGGGDQERAQPALQRCWNCGKTGHNARACTIDTKASSGSDASMTYVSSLFDSDEIGEL
jgi:hypothetical protein